MLTMVSPFTAENDMAKYGLALLLGVPIPILIIVYFFSSCGS